MRRQFSLFAGFAAAQRRFAKKYCRGSSWHIGHFRLNTSEIWDGSDWSDCLGIPTLVQGPSVVSWRDINGPQLGFGFSLAKRHGVSIYSFCIEVFHFPSMIVNACYHKHAILSAIFLSRLQPRHLLVQNLCKRQSQRWKSPRNLAMFCRSCSRDFLSKVASQEDLIRFSFSWLPQPDFQKMENTSGKMGSPATGSGRRWSESPNLKTLRYPERFRILMLFWLRIWDAWWRLKMLTSP